MTDFDSRLADALGRELPLRAELAPAWRDVLARAEAGRGFRRRRGRPLVVAVVATLALAGAGVAIAVGLGAFNGLSRTQHPQTASDKLGRKALVSVKTMNRWTAELTKQWNAYRRAHGMSPLKPNRILPGSTRILGRLPLRGAGKVYAATDTYGQLCIIVEGTGPDCNLALSRLSRPALATSIDWWPHGVWGPVAYGIAMDGVTSVSFRSKGKGVTVPVKHNLWSYVGPNTAQASLTVHFADGSTEVVHQGCVHWTVARVHGVGRPVCRGS